jgi:hypothetical protein
MPLFCFLHWWRRQRWQATLLSTGLRTSRFYKSLLHTHCLFQLYLHGQLRCSSPWLSDGYATSNASSEPTIDAVADFLRRITRVHPPLPLPFSLSKSWALFLPSFLRPSLPEAPSLPSLSCLPAHWWSWGGMGT